MRIARTLDAAPPVALETVYRVVDAIDAIAGETGRSVPQIAISWLLQRPTVSTVILGARNEQQLREILASVGWSLTAEQMAALDEASAATPPYPYWHQLGFAERNPFPTAAPR
ncbi:MAG TPA: aldo/keto reductase [Anaeromyxobacteraceae bacterium]|nr:aldo/keto reductase [Anaeromyxobacteraceae bacterium]